MKNRIWVIILFVSIFLIGLIYAISFISPDNFPFYTNKNSLVVNYTDTKGNSTFVDLDNSLVGWWRLNNESDENATLFKDSSTYSNNGTCTGASCPNFTTAGVFGGAYIFYGGPYISIPASSSLNLTNSSAFSLWFNMTGLIALQSLISSNHYHTTGYNGNWVFRVATNYISFASYDGQSNEQYSNVAYTVNNNTWYHIVASLNGVNVTFYMNGVYAGSFVHTKALSDGATNGITIGNDISGTNKLFNGTLDDILIFNRSLSSTEIKSLYDSQANKYYKNFTSLSEGTHTIKAYTQNFSGSVFNSSLNTFITDYTLPQINFTSPTPANNSAQNYNWVFVNISSNDTTTANTQGNHSVFVDWNRSLVGWWKMEQGNGTFFADSSTWGNNGSCTGTACPIYTSAGARGGGYVFDGVANHITIPSLNIGTIHSASIWIDFQDSVGGVVIGRNSTGYLFYIDQTKVYYSTGDTNFVSVAHNGLTSGKWNYLSVIRNGTAVNFYKNGAQLGVTQTLSSNTTISDIVSIGSYGSGAIPTTMRIDDVLIFSRALSAQEILALYNTQANQYYNNFTGLIGGNYSYQGYVQDMAGNVNSTEMRQVTIDIMLPNATLISPTNNSFLNYLSNINFTANLSDDIRLGNTTLYIYSSSGLYNSTTTTFTGITNTIVGTLVNLVDNVYKWFYQLFDSVGNSFLSENNTLTIDTINPAINFTNPTYQNGSYNSKDYILENITFSDTNIKNATIRLYNVTKKLVNESNSTTSSFYYNFSKYSDGIYYINASIIDQAGNKNDTETRNITLDYTNPLINYTFPTPLNKSIIKTSYFEINTSFSDTNFLNVTYFLFNSSSLVNITSSDLSIFEYTFRGIPDGIYFFNVTVWDKAGNYNSTLSKQITIDTVPAVISGGGSPGGSGNTIQTITLDDFLIVYDKLWNKDSENIIYIDILDINKKLIDVDNINFSTNSSLHIVFYDLIKISQGKYYKKFYINETGNITMKISATQLSKTINKDINIEIRELNYIEDVKKQLDNFIENTKSKTNLFLEFIKENYLILMGIAIVFIMFCLVIILAKKNKNN